jgi:hypothetical protein
MLAAAMTLVHALPLRCILLLLAASTASLGLAGCGGGDTAEDGDVTAGGETGDDDGWDDWGDEDEEPSVESHHGAVEALGISGPDQPWAEMSFEEREWYMVGKVLPIMKEIFAEQDERWASGYGCESCHGEEMEEVEYAMPPASSYKVPEPGTRAWATMERIFGDTVVFMKDDVTPTMGTLLGVEDYTCWHCHQRAE